ncbi:MAG: hypothetical protein JWN93_16 [Hyphomicrobiales bacterium]|nr:hypothetical protein [Hyphomicrobiales bacterium]
MRTRVFSAFLLVAALLSAGPRPAAAQDAPLEISWEVRNRFRMFAREADFERLAAAHEGGGVLDAERRLAAQDGFGWAKDVGALCFNPALGRVKEFCERDGLVENYLNPVKHRVALRVAGAEGAACAWTITSGAVTSVVNAPCEDALEHRFPSKQASAVSVVARRGGAVAGRGAASVAVRDLLVVGMGDSIASGEGNPLRAVPLSDNGFCFRRLLDGRRFYLPARAVSPLAHDCPMAPEDAQDDAAFHRVNALWLFSACHRSLYSYQARAALAHAIREKHGAVTYVPLACTGATIQAGILGSQPARERPLVNGRPGPATVPAQIFELEKLTGKLGTRPLVRTPDVILLTIGANDIGFSGLVAHVMTAPGPERTLLKAAGAIVEPAASRRSLRTVLRPQFAQLRARLAPFVDGDMKRIVFASYPNPALAAPGQACGTSRQGFDAHPAFTVNGGLTADAVRFVEEEFLPVLRGLAACEGGACPASRAMTYVDAHRAAFETRGFCATGAGDPAFDTACFRNGGSFNGAPEGLMDPLACARPATAFRPYAARQRWVRTPNDSYFTAMTYPASSPLRPRDIHDAVWGMTSAVYGGAIHPTAEGHAAIADAVLPTLAQAHAARPRR